MGKRNKHRRGSLAFRPRKRSKTQMPRVTFWPESKEKRVLGFAGYKAGMTHIVAVDDSASASQGMEVSRPVTVLEVPPMVVFGVRGYGAGNVTVDVVTDDEKILKHMGMKNSRKNFSALEGDAEHQTSDTMKKEKKNELKPAGVLAEPARGPLSEASDKWEGIDEVYLLVYAQPDKTGIGKKKPERMEVPVGGKDTGEKIEFALSLLGKELAVSDVFKAGEYVDTISVSTGKGFQGPVKRFGVKHQRRKATGKGRHVGSLGPWHPAYVMYTAPLAGQLGYNKRTELNKRIMRMGKPEEITVKGGFKQYGVVKSDYVLLNGSIPGPTKRLIRLRKAVRKPEVKAPEVKYVSLESQQ